MHLVQTLDPGSPCCQLDISQQLCMWTWSGRYKAWTQLDVASQCRRVLKVLTTVNFLTLGSTYMANFRVHNIVRNWLAKFCGSESGFRFCLSVNKPTLTIWFPSHGIMVGPSLVKIWDIYGPRRKGRDSSDAHMVTTYSILATVWYVLERCCPVLVLICDCSLSFTTQLRGPACFPSD